VKQVPFFSLSGSDFVEMFVGVGFSCHDLFKQTRRNLLLLYREIDAVGRARGKVICQVEMMKEEHLESILTEMDGLGPIQM
jgi:ATP-dependent Zn protease